MRTSRRLSMLALACLLVTPAVAAPPQVDALIGRLDDPSYAVRQRATDALGRLGAEAVAPLERLLRSAETSPEARRRAGRALARVRLAVRWAGIQGGAIVDGLQATLRSTRDRYAAGTPVVLQLELRNVGRMPLELTRIARIDRRMHAGRGRLQEKQLQRLAKAAQATLHVTQLGKRAYALANVLEELSAVSPRRGPTLLAPGQRLIHRFSVVETSPWRGRLQPGRYQLQVAYSARWSGVVAVLAGREVRSNTLEIEVTGTAGQLQVVERLLRR